MQALAKLFGSPARLKTIRLFVFNKEHGFSSAEVAERTKLSKEAARREIAELLAARFIRKKTADGVISYQTNRQFEHLDALDNFIRETNSVEPKEMVGQFKKAGALRLVVLTGFFTNVLESQVDILIAGDRLSERTIATAVRSLEAELGREVRYAVFATEDFRYRFGVYDRLLRDIFDYPHRLLIDKIGL